MSSSTVLTFTDPYEYQKSVRGAEVQQFVTAPGEYRAELTRIDLHKLWMQRSREVLPRVSHAANSTSRNVIFFLADAQQPSMHHTGMELPPGCIRLYSAGAEHYHRSWTACHWASMSLTADDLASAGLDIAGRHLVAPRVTRPIRPPPHLMSRLMKLHEAAGNLAATVPDLLAHHEVARAIEQELIHVTVRCLSEGATGRTDEHTRLPVMRRFEQALEANEVRPLYLAEICRAIGVSARTLHLHCREHLGMGPHRYLWLRRMNLARHALLAADPAAKTVTEIATELGFWELGRFAVAYRKLFGEPPSTTLRNPAG